MDITYNLGTAKTLRQQKIKQAHCWRQIIELEMLNNENAV